MPEIVSFTCVGNRRSQAVMRRLGMRQDAHAFAHPSLPRDSPLSRHVLFRLARANWAASNGE